MHRSTSASFRAGPLLALLAVSAIHVNAQADLPNLSTATEPGATSASATSKTNTNTSPSSSATAQTSATNGKTTASATSTGTSAATTSSSSNAFTATFPDATTSTSTGAGGTPFSLTGLPTIAGAGIPTMVIPYTANAPFMQKSSMPEGTVFIAVGAVLGLLGAAVLLWRGMVAWSINRSVKRNSRAAMGGSEKSTGWGPRGGGGGGGGSKGAYYKEYEMGSTMSLDALNRDGKAARNSTFPDEGKRQSSAPPAGLFFSPTAQASSRVSSVNLENRGSTYLPAGYYASPNSEAAGGRSSTVIGSNLAPYARHSAVDPSPPGSPAPGSRATSNNFYQGGNPYPTSRDGLRPQSGLRNASREGLQAGLRAPPSRDGYSSQRNSSVLHNNPSSSSLMVGMGGRPSSSNEHLAGQRAPSAVLDELFENHGNGPRERF